MEEDLIPFPDLDPGTSYTMGYLPAEGKIALYFADGRGQVSLSMPPESLRTLIASLQLGLERYDSMFGQSKGAR
jgi:hypothetical protein